MAAPALLAGLAAEEAKEASPIFIVEVDRLSHVPSRHHVVNSAREFNPKWT
jgi:hypothetical protein